MAKKLNDYIGMELEKYCYNFFYQASIVSSFDKAKFLDWLK